MTKKLKHSQLWHRLLCLLMAFYVINVSIDAPDGYVTPNGHGEYREDLSINEIESLGELVLEEFFDLHDIVPEHDESNEEEDQLNKIFMDWSIPSPVVIYLLNPGVGFLPPTRMPFKGLIYRSNPTKINTPPPTGPAISSSFTDTFPCRPFSVAYRALALPYRLCFQAREAFPTYFPIHYFFNSIMSVQEATHV